MSGIRPLDPAVVSLIAAGEVVERPALAVKELVENSLDARARGITVELRDGGLSYFRVTDNGAGIPREELALAFTRSATSKLRSAEDLAGIATMGFRGEALSSIAAVSRVTLTSRARGEDFGAAIDVDAGRVAAVRDAASPEGTTVVVKDIFYNVPARRKFLKKPVVETAYATDWIIKLAAAWPDVSVRLINQGRQTFRSAGDGSARGVLAAAWGLETAERLFPVSGMAAGCVAEGFVGVGEDARYGRAQQWLFLNRRAVRASALADAVELACRERVLIGRSPIFALWLTMDYAAVDVNVHPNKLEVRFGNERDVREGIAGLVGDALRRVMPGYAVMPGAGESPFRSDAGLPETVVVTAVLPRETAGDDDLDAPLVEKARDAEVPSPNVRPRLSAEADLFPYGGDKGVGQRGGGLTVDGEGVGRRGGEMAVDGEEVERREEQLPIVTPLVGDATETAEGVSVVYGERPFRVFGAAFDQYILVEQGETLYIIDQHAAHERFLYDKFMAALDTVDASQPMLSPLTVGLSHREAALVEANASFIEQAGFTIEPFGERAIRATSVPMVMGSPAPELIRAVIDALDEFAEIPTAKKRRDALIKLACKKAIKGGDPLTLNQIAGLLEALSRSHTMPTCPHGRPICVAVEKKDLDRRFKRIV